MGSMYQVIAAKLRSECPTVVKYKNGQFSFFDQKHGHPISPCKKAMKAAKRAGNDKDNRAFETAAAATLPATASTMYTIFEFLSAHFDKTGGNGGDPLQDVCAHLDDDGNIESDNDSDSGSQSDDGDSAGGESALLERDSSTVEKISIFKRFPAPARLKVSVDGQQRGGRHA